MSGETKVNIEHKQRGAPIPTFLERAVEDLEELKTNRQNRSFYKGSSLVIINSVSAGIEEAEREGYDDTLYLAYKNHNDLIRKFRGTDGITTILQSTLDDIKEGRIKRQIRTTDTKLVQENAELKATLRRMETTYEKATKEFIKEKDKQLKAIQAENKKTLAEVIKQKDEQIASITKEKKDVLKEKENMMKQKDDMIKILEETIRQKDLIIAMLTGNRKPSRSENRNPPPPSSEPSSPKGPNSTPPSSDDTEIEIEDEPFEEISSEEAFANKNSPRGGCS